MTKQEQVKVNSVVQINENGQQGWIGCLVQVTELKSFGIQGYVEVPMQGKAFIRLSWDDFDFIGEALMLPQNIL